MYLVDQQKWGVELRISDIVSINIFTSVAKSVAQRDIDLTSYNISFTTYTILNIVDYSYVSKGVV
jgi:hypothetical protein